MNCPYCQFQFKVLAMNAPDGVPDIAPLICESCEEVSLFENGQLRTMTKDELAAIKKSPAYRQVILPLKRLIQSQKKASNAQNN